MSEDAVRQGPDSKQRLGKAVMVPVWSSGFIVGTLAVRHASGLSILFWRMGIASLVMAGICLAMRVEWPRDRRTVLQMVLVGLLLQAAQFVGIFLALEHGVSAGLTALLAGSSPLIVAVLATALLDEHLKPIQWVGSLIGVAGVVFAVIESLNGGGSAIGFVFAVVGLAGLVGGTLVQRVGGANVDPRAGLTIQLVVATLVIAPLTALTENFDLGTGALAPVVWLTFGLSIGAVMLFFWLLKREKSGEATSFLYLVPATTAIGGAVFLGQPLQLGAVIGLALAFIGVRMVSSPDRIVPFGRGDRDLSTDESTPRSEPPQRLSPEST
ncbi:MAG TPA: DMT family transporter [Solirubrobacterales bacterium]